MANRKLVSSLVITSILIALSAVGCVQDAHPNKVSVTPSTPQTTRSSSSNPSIPEITPTRVILNNPSNLIIKSTSNRSIDCYFYKNGKWIKKEFPSIWWMYVSLSNIKVYFKDVKASYAGVVVAAQTVKDSDVPIGGVFIDAGRRIVFVYVKDEDDGRKVLSMVNGNARVILLKANYTLNQLEIWKSTLSERIKRDKLLSPLWSGISPSHTMNKVTVDFEKINDTVLREFEGICRELEIPLDAVAVEKLPKPVAI